MKLPHPLASASLARPTAVAVQLGEALVDYRTLAQRVAGWAGWLAAQGVQPTDTVVLAGPLGLPWLEGLLAVGWLGAAAVPLAPDSQEVPAWALPAAAAAAAAPRTFVWSPGAPEPAAAVAPPLPGAPLGAPAPPAESQAQLLVHDPTGWRAPPLPEPVWEADAVVLRLSTSGTTGLPRPVDLTAGGLMAAALGAALRLGHLPGDCWLCCLPLHHIGGLMVVWRALWTASTLLWQPRFEAAAATSALYGGRVTLAALVPTMLQRACDLAPSSPSPAALRAIMLGGAPASPALLADARARGLPVAPCWGMSESAAAVACAHPGAPTAPGDCGPPLAFARVSADAAGRLQLAGAQLGRRAEASPYDTCDLGHLDAAGHVHLAGRGDDVIISGGVNLPPEPIEAALLELPGVAEVAVVPMPDRQWGQRPAALLVMTVGQPPPTLASLRRHVRARLGGAQAPDRAWLCGRLDVGPLGKLRRRAMADVLRRRLRAMAEAGVGSAVGLELGDELAPDPAPTLSAPDVTGQKSAGKTGSTAALGGADVYRHRMDRNSHEDR